ELFTSGGDDECLHWRLVPATNAASPPVLQAVEVPGAEKRTSLSIVSNLFVFTSPLGSAVVGLEKTGAPGLPSVRTAPWHNEVSPVVPWLAVFPSYSPFVYVYRLPGIVPVTTLRSEANSGAVEFSPAGNQMAVSSRKGIEFWTTNDWTRTTVLTNFSNILFSP